MENSKYTPVFNRDVLLARIKNEYLRRIKMEENPGRKREFIEMRSALNNSLWRFCSDTEIGKVWNKHRTTVIHSTRMHETYYRNSPMYRMCYTVSEDIIDTHSKELLDTSTRRVGRGASNPVIRSNNNTNNEMMRLQSQIDKKTYKIDTLTQERDDLRRELHTLRLMLQSETVT